MPFSALSRASCHAFGRGALLLGVSLLAHQAAAQTAASAPPAPPSPASGDQAGEPGQWTGWLKRDTLLGDAWGIRTKLGNYGINIGLTDANEVFGNVTGGMRKGWVGEGLTMLTVGLDTDKAFGWEGGKFNISAMNIRGRSLSQWYIGNLQTNSGIAATPTTRLWEIWFQQSFFNDKFDIRLGQQSIDQEFMTSEGSAYFLNTMMGWPMFPSANLYAGGPAYPLSSLGVRLRAKPGGGFTILGGVFQDNPPGGPFDDDGQLRGSTRWGGNFNLRTGALVIGEVQYAVNQPEDGQMDTPGTRRGLPGTYKLGFWYDSAGFPNQRYDAAGISLASPYSTGVANLQRPNFSFYGVVDQTVWQPADSSDPRAIGVFARAMGGPGNVNLISYSLNTGVTFKGFIPGRHDDVFGIGYGLANVSYGARGLDQDMRYFSGTPMPIRASESFVEVTYQAAVTPWWVVQPDFQYVWTPAGGVINPYNPAKRIGNAAIFGVRSTITF